jgi:hypothetical protein
MNPPNNPTNNPTNNSTSKNPSIPFATQATLERVYDHPSIRAALHQQALELPAFFASVPLERFWQGSDQQWSPAHQVQHLITAIEAVTQGLHLLQKLPQWAIQAASGLSKNVTALAPRSSLAAQLPSWEAGYRSRSWTDIRQIYQHILQKGAKASGKYLPQLPMPPTRASQHHLTQQLGQTLEDLTQTLNNWSETQLEQIKAPHPLLGVLSIREMLFFTLYHNMHHALQVYHALNKTAPHETAPHETAPHETAKLER